MLRGTLLCAMMAVGMPAVAHDGGAFVPSADHGYSVTLMGGALLQGSFPGLTVVPFATPFDHNYLTAAAFDARFLDLGDGMEIGGEVGVAARYGAGFTGEAWGGLVIRYHGFHVGHLVISPAIVGGFSAVSGAIGIEAQRAASQRGNPTFLFYAGPEIALSLDTHPNWEFVFRVHHRSGGFGTLGNMHEGANGNMFGLRYRY